MNQTFTLCEPFINLLQLLSSKDLEISDEFQRLAAAKVDQDAPGNISVVGCDSSACCGASEVEPPIADQLSNGKSDARFLLDSSELIKSCFCSFPAAEVFKHTVSLSPTQISTSLNPDGKNGETVGLNLNCQNFISKFLILIIIYNQ